MKDEQLKECVRLLGQAILSARPDTARALVDEAERALEPVKVPVAEKGKEKADDGKKTQSQ